MRILIGAIGHESNTFTPFLTTLEDFYVLYGSDILNRPPRRSSLDGIVTTLQAHNVELVPTVAAGAMPGGVVEYSAYETFKRAVLREADASCVDGVCLWVNNFLGLHGEERLRKLKIHKIARWVADQYEVHHRTTAISEREMEEQLKKHLPDHYAKARP